MKEKPISKDTVRHKVSLSTFSCQFPGVAQREERQQERLSVLLRASPECRSRQVVRVWISTAEEGVTAISVDLNLLTITSGTAGSAPCSATEGLTQAALVAAS